MNHVLPFGRIISPSLITVSQFRSLKFMQRNRGNVCVLLKVAQQFCGAENLNKINFHAKRNHPTVYSFILRARYRLKKHSLPLRRFKHLLAQQVTLIFNRSLFSFFISSLSLSVVVDWSYMQFLIEKKNSKNICRNEAHTMCSNKISHHSMLVIVTVRIISS